jgi:hypothetical protein
MQSHNSDTISQTGEIFALQALAFLVQHEKHLSRFLMLTGTDLGTLRTNAQDQQTLANVLDFMLSDERLLLEWCEADQLHPHAVATARRQLPGFDAY